MPLPDSKLSEIVNEYTERAQLEIEVNESLVELEINDEETTDFTVAFLFSSVVFSIMQSTQFYPDFDYLSKEIIQELKKEEIRKDWEKSMKKYGFFGDWDEVFNLLSPTGLMNAYTWMCQIDLTATTEDLSIEEYKFGDLFKADSINWKQYIPVTIYQNYNSNKRIGEALSNLDLVQKIQKLSGISFSYNYQLANNLSLDANPNSDQLASNILDIAFSEESQYLYLKKWVVSDKKWLKIGITNNPERRDSEQNVLPVPAELLKIIKIPNRNMAEKIEKELLDMYVAKRIKGANNKELFELDDDELDHLIKTFNSLDKKLNY